ncbi:MULTISPECIES: DUF4168 domain-containing protein [unclassified Coleofasciculus]|uniref:DUF4168 domain-containing protein n=1 Tax=unclassified Coleofasciculus TaxID=2692782 RepID=UPI00187E027B|nr:MULTISPECIES: DUF4168 domain-containing protein [unclassified Coleofasciculus]MBE9130035.1 DUF4168 domain-containing protein [Coleofasciculus sp. LEGE 07081]MBE9152385.1 DUF4168 domain-containing protein [Coleofasciculus sp. LEGE 07092]
MMPFSYSQPHLKNLSRSLAVVILATASCLSGVIPELSDNSLTLVFSNSAYAQSSVSDPEITSYAQAILAMEPLRQETYNEIKKIIGYVPEIQCHLPDSINKLPNEARKIAENYCRQSLSLVANYLNPPRFNEITRLADKNEDLRRRIQRRLLELQG